MPHHLDYPAAVRRDGLALAEAAEAARPAAPIAACPCWDVVELVWHLTEVHYFWGEIVACRLADPEAVPPLERPEPFPALLARFRSGSSAWPRCWPPPTRRRPCGPGPIRRMPPS